MKRLISVVLPLFMVLGFLGVSACGGASEEFQTTAEKSTTKPAAPATATATGTASSTATATKTASASGGLTWDDMPIYPGAEEVQTASVNAPTDTEADWEHMEFKGFQSSDDYNAICDFYKASMPDNGWDQKTWMDLGRFNAGSYTKNHEKDGAVVWISESEGTTTIQMMRASE